MSTAKLSLRSVFGVITNTASAVGDIADTIGESSRYLNSEVKTFAAKQAEDNSLELKIHKQTSLENKSVELAQHWQAIAKYRSSSAQAAELYDKAFELLSK